MGSKDRNAQRLNVRVGCGYAKALQFKRAHKDEAYHLSQEKDLTRIDAYVLLWEREHGAKTKDE